MENAKLQENTIFAKDKALLILTGIFFSILIFLPDAFDSNLKLCGIFLFVFIFYFTIRQILEKGSNQPFNFIKLFKESGFSLVGLAIFYFLTTLLNFINESFYINFYFPKNLSFLIGIAGFFLMMFAFQIIEKYVKN